MEKQKQKRSKRICLDLSLSRAKEIRAMNKKDDPSIPQAPTLAEWKKFGNLEEGIMIPDRGFTKQLHVLDEELDVAWDWGSEKWEIWKFPKNGDVACHIMTVQTKDRKYRELGADVLLKLQKGDPGRFSAGQFVRYFEEMDKQVRRRKEKEFRDLITDMAMDSFLNLHCKIIQVPQEYAVERAVEV
jgi:hypothetical protein